MGDADFRVFGLDRQVYGPVSATTLLEWARDGRVQRDTWVHWEADDQWRRAEKSPQLEPHFKAEVSSAAGRDASAGPAEAKSGVAPRVLNRLRAFTDMTPEELAPFAAEMVEESYRPFSFIVRQGDLGDAMYFVLQGKVGVSTEGQITESFLVALTIGDTFGEMSLFDPSPRSAHVRAENDVIVLKFTADALRRVCETAPGPATKFLRNMARLLSARVRTMDKRAATARDLDAASREIRD
jgi:CRP/FNR family cyclic AMP-dependent transcriptional regulator